MGAFGPIHWLIILVVVAVPAGLVLLLLRRKKGAPAGGQPRQFRDPTRLTRILQFLLVTLMAMCVISSLSEIAQYRLLESAFTPAEGAANDQRQRIIASIHVLTYFLTVVVFGRWIYRMNANARALGADYMRFTPGWSVGWYFVPLACLWKPYEAMKEIWRASKVSKRSQNDRIVGWWWGGWIVSNILGNIDFRLTMAAKDLKTLSIASAASVVDDVFDIFAITLALILVSRLSRMQKAKRTAQLTAALSEASAV
jgi:hypothetical protein